MIPWCRNGNREIQSCDHCFVDTLAIVSAIIPEKQNLTSFKLAASFPGQEDSETKVWAAGTRGCVYVSKPRDTRNVTSERRANAASLVASLCNTMSCGWDAVQNGSDARRSGQDAVTRTDMRSGQDAAVRDARTDVLQDGAWRGRDGSDADRNAVQHAVCGTTEHGAQNADAAGDSERDAAQQDAGRQGRRGRDGRCGGAGRLLLLLLLISAPELCSPKAKGACV